MMGGGFHGMWRAGRSETPVRITRAMLLRILGYFRPYWRESSLVLLTVGAISHVLLTAQRNDKAFCTKSAGFL